MKLYIEEHLKQKMSAVLLRVDSWNLSFDIEYIKNISTLPYAISESQDKTWSIIMPLEQNTAFVYDLKLHADVTKRYAGGAYSHRFSIIIDGSESDEILELRIVHEYLHSIGKAADDLLRYLANFLTWWERVLWKLGLIHVDAQSPYWQRKYYKYLKG